MQFPSEYDNFKKISLLDFILSFSYRYYCNVMLRKVKNIRDDIGVSFSFQELCRVNLILIGRTILFVGNCYHDHAARACLTSDIQTLLPLSTATSSASIQDVSSSCSTHHHPVASSRCGDDRRQHQWSTITRRCSVSCNMLRRTVVALSDLGLRKLFP